MFILSRPPGDLFTFRLFYKLVAKEKDYDSIYTWSAAIEPSYLNPGRRHLTGGFLEHETEVHLRTFLQENISKDTIVLGVKDHLTTSDYNPWVEKMPPTAEYLDQFANFYSNKQIILLTSVENLDYYIKRPNVTIVPWGGDITNHQREYKSLTAITDKNFDSDYTYISLNRNPRNHRKVLLSMLCGLSLEDKGLISCMFKETMNECQDIITETKWQFRSDQMHIKEIIETGFSKFKSFELLLTDDKEIYYQGNNDNVGNFKNKLSNYYQNTFVEIVSETSYTERCYLLTEKTLNSIYGMNFPILLAGKGAVSLLRTMGMDMFDDIIDHSYDEYENPIDRMYYALERNKKVLTDSNYIKEQWKANVQRLQKNVAWAKTTMYDFYEARTIEHFSNCCKNTTFEAGS